jgi:hypothetical protein
MIRGQDGRWVAQCPAHDDQHASLSVRLGNRGQLLLKCHAPGCGAKAQDVLDAINRLNASASIRMCDLFSDSLVPFRSFCMSNATQSAPVPTASATPQASAPPRKHTHTYPYKDETGKLLYECWRFDPKSFMYRCPNPAFDVGKPEDTKTNPRWLWKLPPSVRRVLYRLPEMLAEINKEPRKIIVLCEGEKDVDALWDIGAIATTCPMGAEKWLTDYNAFLKDRSVIVFPDNDPIDPNKGYSPGIRHAEEVADHLIGIAKSIRVIHIPGVGPKGDISDWLVSPEIKDLPKNEKLAKLGALRASVPLWDGSERYKARKQEAEAKIAQSAPGGPTPATPPSPPHSPLSSVVTPTPVVAVAEVAKTEPVSVAVASVPIPVVPPSAVPVNGVQNHPHAIQKITSAKSPVASRWFVRGLRYLELTHGEKIYTRSMAELIGLTACAARHLESHVVKSFQPGSPPVDYAGLIDTLMTIQAAILGVVIGNKTVNEKLESHFVNWDKETGGALLNDEIPRFDSQVSTTK